VLAIDQECARSGKQHKRNRNSLLVREAQEPFGTPIAPQWIQQESQQTIKEQIPAEAHTTREPRRLNALEQEEASERNRQQSG